MGNKLMKDPCLLTTRKVCRILGIRMGHSWGRFSITSALEFTKSGALAQLAYIL